MISKEETLRYRLLFKPVVPRKSTQKFLTGLSRSHREIYDVSLAPIGYDAISQSDGGNVMSVAGETQKETIRKKRAATDAGKVWPCGSKIEVKRARQPA